LAFIDRLAFFKLAPNALPVKPCAVKTFVKQKALTALVLKACYAFFLIFKFHFHTIPIKEGVSHLDKPSAVTENEFTVI
jgi:hypothetical protein